MSVARTPNEPPSARPGFTGAWSPVARTLCVVAAIGMSISSCSDEGGPVADSEASGASSVGTASSTGTAQSNSSESSSTGASDQPVSVATIPSDLPEIMKGQVGEVEVIGTPLPLKPTQGAIDADPARGAVAPIVIGTSFSGEEIRIDAAKSGRPTVVYFFAHWCPHCNAEIPILNQLRDSSAFRPDLDIFAISTAPFANRVNFPPSQWITDMDWTYPTMPDGVADGGRGYLASQSFGLDGYPMAVLINPDGTVAARFGPTEDGDQVISYINQYLSY